MILTKKKLEDYIRSQFKVYVSIPGCDTWIGLSISEVIDLLESRIKKLEDKFEEKKD